MNISDAIRDIWADNPTLTSEVPVATDASNRFFEDDIPRLPEGASSASFASVADLGSRLVDRYSSGTVYEKSLLITIGTNEKPKTETLYLEFKDALESSFCGTVTDVGSVCDFVFQSVLFQATPNGFHECQVNLEITQASN